MTIKTKNKMKNITVYAVLILVGFLFAVPLLWLVLASFDAEATVALDVPESWTIDNFRQVLLDQVNISGFLNSTLISLTQMVIVLVCAIMAAYPLSRYALKVGQRISIGLLFFTAIPATAIMVPVYQMFISLGLIDSTIGVILFLSTTALPYAIWMTKNFMDSVPVDLEEAAWIDGASAFQTTINVILPLMLPGLFTVATYAFIGSWGNFFVPFILLQSTDLLPASVNIYRFFGERGTVIYGQLAAYSIMYIMPVFVLHFFSQKYMSQGFTMGGAAKG